MANGYRLPMSSVVQGCSELLSAIVMSWQQVLEPYAGDVLLE